MEIHIQELASKGTEIPIRESLNAEWLREVRKDILHVSPLEVKLDASGKFGVVHLDGELSLDIEMACSRCLEPVKQQIVVPFHERFKPANAKNGDNGGADEDVIVIDEDKLDLEPLVEETMMLSLPFVPLCDEGCKGLCHTCGANLNEADCGCSKDRIDPRLAALKDLFKES
ncbi:YceD family protein [Paenibacillus mendelii]|uniref:DUF177 domain-containing protein n=1 Tax=Paenibacillus mendelii TaxID=206163 RepID=A0ABV6JGN7_9BACL|nr:DUF177 domain-containing protein [Paenibacillus mendelii]MCQ6557959.1 DUF177 domain-containing protein [Paenibacillus mendelii]